MINQNLFLPVCGSVLFVMILVVIIFGMRSRFRFASRLRSGYRDQQKFENWLRIYRGKQRLLLLIALISNIGIITLGGLIFSGILFPSKISLIVFIFLLLTGTISGIIIFIDLTKLAK